MQLRRIAALETEKIESEYNELKDLIKDLNELLGSKQKIFEVIKQETSELKEKYGDKRLTKLHKEELGQWNREDVEPHEESVVTLSRNGYLKRVKSDTFRRQHRGGKGVKGQKMTKEDDVTPYMQIADTHDTILLFTDRGRVFSSRVFDLPANQSRNSRGTPVHNIVALEAREKVNAILTVPEIDQKLESYIVMATKNGRIKTMDISKFKNLRKSGLHSFKLKPDDELVSVALALPLIEIEKNNIIKLVVNKKNPDRGVSYVIDSLTEIDTNNIDKDLIDPQSDKKDSNILKKEGGRKYFSIVDNKGKETAVKVYPDIVMVSNAGKQIRFSVESVRPQGRIAGGVRGMRLDSKQRVVAMVLTSKDPNSYILVASQKGFGKLSKMEHFKVQKQGGTGLMTMKITTKNGKVADAQAVKLDKESGTSDSVYLLTEKAVVQEIPMDEISIYGRSTQGSTLMKLQPGDKISAIRAVSSDPSTQEEEPKKGDSKKKSKK
jgi:DNA gyrase subunit A